MSLLALFLAAGAKAESDTSADPVRDMLLAHFQTVQGGYHRLIKSVLFPADLGIGPEELNNAIDSLGDALRHWKIEFHSGYAAFAVQTATHLLAVNPVSMPDILQGDADVLLHESVHLSDSQVRRQLYGLHSELVFLDWLQDHLDEDKASRVEAQLGRTLNPDDIVRLKLWSPELRTDSAPIRAAEDSLRVSWICETQAYYVQMLVFDRQLKQEGAKSLKEAAGMLRKTLASETGFVGEDDVAISLFQSFSPLRVTDGFQDAVLSCVLMDAHNKVLFQAVAEGEGWDLTRAQKDVVYHGRLFAWARHAILRWSTINSEPYALSESDLQDLRHNGLIAVP